MGYDLDNVGRAVERLSARVDDLADDIKDADEGEKKEFKMGDIAGLLSLLQGNKNMDIPGLLALCKEKGYDRGWGNDGMFMFVFLILFLFAGGGWGNLNPNNRAAFQNAAGGAQNCSDIVAIFDRIQAAQTASSQGFQQVETHLCQSIAEVMNAVRNQGDRAVGAVTDASAFIGSKVDSVAQQISSCCCTVQGMINGVLNKVDGLYGHTSLMQERTHNELQAMECRLQGMIQKNNADMALGFERTQCLVANQFKEQELERLRRENTELKTAAQGSLIAQATAQQLQGWAMSMYKPTAGSSSSTAAAS